MGLDEKATGRRRGLTGPGEAGPEGGVAAAGDGVVKQVTALKLLLVEQEVAESTHQSHHLIEVVLDGLI